MLTEDGEEWLAEQTEKKAAMGQSDTQQGGRGQEDTVKAIIENVRYLHENPSSQKYLLPDVVIEMNKLNPASFGSSSIEFSKLRGIFKERAESPGALKKKGIPGVEEVETVMSNYQLPASAVNAIEAPAEEPASRPVFIVHGHDEGKREATARLITKVTGTEPIILFEQPAKGRTLIEKLEQHGSDAGFAVVLLTADDVGKAKDAAEWNPRARQNVVAELFWFVGKIGRENVAVLYEEGVEFPSDYHGVEYIKLDDSGAWRTKIVLRTAGGRFQR